jgi:hypothetical protein
LLWRYSSSTSYTWVLNSDEWWGSLSDIVIPRETAREHEGWEIACVSQSAWTLRWRQQFPLSAEDKHLFSGHLARNSVRKQTDLLSSFLVVLIFWFVILLVGIWSVNLRLPSFQIHVLNIKYSKTRYWCFAMRIRSTKTYDVMWLYYRINVVILLKFSDYILWSSSGMYYTKDVLQGHHNQFTNIKY